MSNPKINPKLTAALVCAVLALAATNALAGPCTSDIAEFEAAIARSQGNPLAGLTAPQSVGAQLGHEPTPASVKQAQERLKKGSRRRWPVQSVMMHKATAWVADANSPRLSECMFCNGMTGDRAIFFK
jgi:hypothetical protein